MVIENVSTVSAELLNTKSVPPSSQVKSIPVFTAASVTMSSKPVADVVPVELAKSTAALIAVNVTVELAWFVAKSFVTIFIPC